MNPTHEDIRKSIVTILESNDHTNEWDGWFNAADAEEQLCNLFLTLLEGLEMEEIENEIDDSDMGFNQAVKEQNQKIARIKEQLKGQHEQ